VHGSFFEEDADPPWLYEVQPERIPAECGEHPIELVEISTRYPTCVVGHVERVGTTIGEGEEAITLPARPPYLGVCCTPGCRLAGAGEHVPYGTPAGYPEARAERYQEAQP